MLFRLIAVFAVVLLCLGAAACPQQGGEEEPELDELTQRAEAAREQAAPPREVVPQPNPITTISKLIDAMNDGDEESFELLLHPDGPAREELMGKFREFDHEHSRIELQDASIRSEEDTETTVLYDMQVHFDDGETKPDFESGWFKLRFKGGAWLIWDVQ